MTQGMMETVVVPINMTVPRGPMWPFRETTHHRLTAL
jgi:hypothetical protein